MKRIKDAMKGVMKQCGFSGTLREFADSLRQDKQHVCSTQAELLAGYQKIMDHVQSKLPSLFYNIPSTPCTLKAMSPEKAKSAPAACVPCVLAMVGCVSFTLCGLLQVLLCRYAGRQAPRGVLRQHRQPARTENLRNGGADAA